MGTVLELFRKLLFLPPGASTVADEIDWLHVFVISMTMLVSAYVFYSATRFTIQYQQKTVTELTKRLVVTWKRESVLIGSIGGIFLVWWVIGFRQYLTLSAAPSSADVVYVTAKQWMWTFTYPDGHETNDVLTVSVGRPTRLVMMSRDVIHSFYVPAFRIKHDVVPGRTTGAWFEAKSTGVFPIYCAEYCGTAHSQMLGSIVVLSTEDYAAFERHDAKSRALGKTSAPELASRGRAIAERRACVACHTLDGQPHVGPTWSRLYGAERKLVGGGTVIADDAYLTRSMMDPGAEVVAGYQNVMPTYQGTLEPSEAASLVELIKALRDGPAVTAGVELPRLDVTRAEGADGGSP